MGETGYAYEIPQEATEHIAHILADGEHRAALRENSIRRAREFNEERFREKILDALKIESMKEKDRLTTFYKIVMRIEEFKAPW